ncbi:hypothetical protein B0H19DRAFT_1254256 [Mycena capillaripes]|nr:hypothetical protein B0H19DRAFT_1254256 [Mycena capillaripes]
MLYKFAHLTLLVSMAGFAIGARHGMVYILCKSTLVTDVFRLHSQDTKVACNSKIGITLLRNLDSDIDAAVAAALQEAKGLATQAINAAQTPCWVCRPDQKAQSGPEELIRAVQVYGTQAERAGVVGIPVHLEKRVSTLKLPGLPHSQAKKRSGSLEQVISGSWPP